jgi:uncharacterized protein (DUF58 family)
MFVRRQLLSDPFFHNGAREYERSDTIKRISWKITARQQRLMVYNDDFTTNQSAVVLLNMQSREYEKDSVYDEDALEECVNVCARIFYDAYAHSVPVRLLSNTSLTDDKRDSLSTDLYTGQEHTYFLLRTLADLPLMNTESFGAYLEGLLPSLDATDIFIVTAYINEKILLLALENPRIKIILAGGVQTQLTDLADILADRLVKV